MNNGSEPPKRHWHGTVGDRYEQLNVWVRGGAIQTLPGRRPSTDMNDRHDSTSSESSNASAKGASPPRNGSGERRRSSTGLFEGLTSTKRNATDPSVAARRQSWLEQSEQGGYLSKLWNTYTRGR
ncbi:hypothetical protein ALT_5252 [Aspergillus lentulus]|uniref:Uncharacterized protein n=1 Tax=Aspergillus lentulus TaxID=293939 RepID=A0AAN6BQA8_ASPLE|nr:uncharacterized protein IFM58399_00875 [Aspergillus lentulus]KAF4160884.1 hypothetical protein CNMCM6069_006792 [Aspergillus lentulus]KAF4169282.1 hypothetical protein CNMCM6936_008642 [Aspergillus lentulus]KAF4180891.1 hypothetical protein CNMCM8060_000366 [Aspergillus lentulus]KAF4189282.1 hypothetical protein CNMCM7927_008570 [Aspergillus lentulus]KAF4197447.1 hypothetical protein CNMCM8694_002713 [Aspergillus lentulus]